MLLSKINSPNDIKQFSQKELKTLCAEIRKTIIEVVGKNGGHLASNLGVVELTVALHRVFESPKDAIVWDVSHQCYAHKLLTGRYKEFSSLRKNQGISGFTKHQESEHDFFDNGHASTSISSSLGLLTAWQLQNREGRVIAVIGDGALTGGMAFEAMSNAGLLSKNLIVIVNDNQMSIDHNTGSLSLYLSRLTMTSNYQFFRNTIDKIVEKLPFVGRSLKKFVFRFKRGLKGLFLSNNLFVDFGFEYVGPLDGHDEKSIEKILRHVKKMNRPVVVHVVTKKGKGYSPAEDNPERFHGVGPFCISDGTVEKFDYLSFTESFSSSLVKIAEKRTDIVAITAAMAKGTGLDRFARHFPERFFDVGIAEEHAVTFAGGLARGGLLPVVCIYSTFIQRSVDQIIHDISLQNLKAIFVLDRSGAVPNDGETHQGIFDISLFRPIPNLVIMSPATSVDLDLCLNFAVEKIEYSSVIRYPKNTCPTDVASFSQKVVLGRGVLVKAEEVNSSLEVVLEDKNVMRVLFVCTGSMYSEVLVASRALLMKNIIADIYSLRFIKPFDEEYFLNIAKNYDKIIFVEDGIKTGGVSEYLEKLCYSNNLKNVEIRAFEEKFYSQGNREQVLKQANMSAEDLSNFKE